MKYLRYIVLVVVAALLFTLTTCAPYNNTSIEAAAVVEYSKSNKPAPTAEQPLKADQSADSVPYATQAPPTNDNLADVQKRLAAAGLNVEWLYLGPDYTSVLFYEKQHNDDAYIISAYINQVRKFGLMNARGEIITPLEYDYISQYAEDSALSPEQKKLFSAGVLDEEGRYWSKQYLIDGAGRLVLDVSKYETAHPYWGKWVVVKQNNKAGVIDWNGKEILPMIYDYAWVLSNGLIRASNYVGDSPFPLDGLFDISGNVITGFEYDIIWVGEPGEDLMYALKNGKMICIDKNGKETAPFPYENELVYRDNMAAVAIDGKWGYIDRSGEIIIPIIYEQAYPFSDGLALVRLEGKYGYVNTRGEIVIPIEYSNAGFFNGGVAVVMKYENGNQCNYVIDKSGRTVIGPKEYRIIEYGNGTYYAGFYDDAETTMSGGRFYALLDRDGNRLTDFCLGSVEYVREGLVVVNDANSITQKLGIYNQYGAEIVPHLFDIIDIVDSKTCLVRLNEYSEDYSYVGVLTLPEDAQTRWPNIP